MLTKPDFDPSKRLLHAITRVELLRIMGIAPYYSATRLFYDKHLDAFIFHLEVDGPRSFLSANITHDSEG